MKIDSTITEIFNSFMILVGLIPRKGSTHRLLLISGPAGSLFLVLVRPRAPKYDLVVLSRTEYEVVLGALVRPAFNTSKLHCLFDD